MKALVVSDVQATEGAERLRSDRTVPLQRWRVAKLMDDLARLMRQHQCHFLVDLGDMTNERHSVPTGTIQVLSDGLAKLAPEPLLSIKLIGNHEQQHKSGLVHAGGLYTGRMRVIADREVCLVNGTDTAIVCVSYQEDNVALSHWLDKTTAKLKADNYRLLLLGHIEVAGASMSGGRLEQGVPLELMRRFNLGLLGHIHRPQCLPGTKVHYLGSPFQQNFGELGEQKRVAVVDFETFDCQFIELPGYPTYRRVNLHELPTDIGEDRYEVTLRTPAEVDAFFRHPLASQVAPVVMIERAAKEGVTESQAPTDLEGWLRTYARETAIDGAQLSTDELVAAGLKLTEA